MSVSGGCNDAGSVLPQSNRITALLCGFEAAQQFQVQRKGPRIGGGGEPLGLQQFDLLREQLAYERLAEPRDFLAAKLARLRSPQL
jgi:hypothetical protein